MVSNIHVGEVIDHAKRKKGPERGGNTNYGLFERFLFRVSAVKRREAAHILDIVARCENKRCNRRRLAELAAKSGLSMRMLEAVVPFWKLLSPDERARFV